MLSTFIYAMIKTTTIDMTTDMSLYTTNFSQCPSFLWQAHRAMGQLGVSWVFLDFFSGSYCIES